MDKDKNVIGIGFLYYYPKDLSNINFDYENNQQINTFKKIYDVNLLMDEGYDYVIKLLNMFENNN